MKYGGQIINGIFPLIPGVKYDSGDMFILSGELYILTGDWSFEGDLSEYISDGKPIGNLSQNCVSYIELHRYRPGQVGVESLITTTSIDSFFRSVFDNQVDNTIIVSDEIEFINKLNELTRNGIWSIRLDSTDEDTDIASRTFIIKVMNCQYGIYQDIIRADLMQRHLRRISTNTETGHDIDDVVNIIRTENGVSGGNIFVNSCKKLTSLIKEYNEHVKLLNKYSSFKSIVRESDENSYIYGTGLKISDEANVTYIKIDILEYDSDTQSYKQYSTGSLPIDDPNKLISITSDSNHVYSIRIDFDDYSAENYAIVKVGVKEVTGIPFKVKIYTE